MVWESEKTVRRQRGGREGKGRTKRAWEGEGEVEGMGGEGEGGIGKRKGRGGRKEGIKRIRG